MKGKPMAMRAVSDLRADANTREMEISRSSNPAVGESVDLIRRLAVCAPAVARAFSGNARELKNSALSPRVAEAVALRVAQLNQSDYCLAAHTEAAKRAGATFAETIDERIGVSENPKLQAILHVATKLTIRHGRDMENELADFYAQGGTEEELLEIVSHVAMNCWANMLALATGVKSDAPPPHPVSLTTER